MSGNVPGASMGLLNPNGFPTPSSPVVDPKTGLVTPVWAGFLQNLNNQAGVGGGTTQVTNHTSVVSGSPLSVLNAVNAVISNDVIALEFVGAVTLSTLGNAGTVVVDVGGVDVIAPSSGPQIVQSAIGTATTGGTFSVALSAAPKVGNTLVLLIVEHTGYAGATPPPPTSNGFVFTLVENTAWTAAWGATLVATSSFQNPTTVVLENAGGVIGVYEVSNASSLVLGDGATQSGTFSVAVGSGLVGVCAGLGLWSSNVGEEVYPTTGAPSNLYVDNLSLYVPGGGVGGGIAGACTFQLLGITENTNIVINPNGTSDSGFRIPFFTATNALFPQPVNTFSIQGNGVQTLYDLNGPTETIVIPGLTLNGASVAQISTGTGLGSTITGIGVAELVLEIPAYLGGTTLGVFDAVEINTGLSGSLAGGTLALAPALEAGTGISLATSGQALIIENTTPYNATITNGTLTAASPSVITLAGAGQTMTISQQPPTVVQYMQVNNSGGAPQTAYTVTLKDAPTPGNILVAFLTVGNSFYIFDSSFTNALNEYPLYTGWKSVVSGTAGTFSYSANTNSTCFLAELSNTNSQLLTVTGNTLPVSTTIMAAGAVTLGTNSTLLLSAFASGNGSTTDTTFSNPTPAGNSILSQGAAQGANNAASMAVLEFGGSGSTITSGVVTSQELTGNAAYACYSFGAAAALGTNVTITIPGGAGGGITEFVQGSITATGVATLGTGLTLTGTLNPTITASGGSGSGTVTSSTAGQLAWYQATGTTVIGNANITYSGGALTIGVAGTQAGSLVLAGNTSGSVTLKTNAAAGSWAMTLPATAGAASQVLTTDGTGLLSWSTPSGGGGTGSYHTVTSSRAIGTVYTNTQAVPIFVLVRLGTGPITPMGCQAVVNSAPISLIELSYANGNTTLPGFFVPPGATYELSSYSGSPTLELWVEYY